MGSVASPEDVDSESSSSSSSSASPDSSTRSRLCSQLASIVNCDPVVATGILRRCRWDVARAVHSWFSSAADSATAAAVPAVPANVRLTSRPPSRFSVLSWNLDGLDGRQLKLRTKAACLVIGNEAPDIVMLQELVHCSHVYMRNKLCQYEWFSSTPSDGASGDYFTAILLRKYRIYGDNSQRLAFSCSHMQRDLLRVDAHIGQLRLALFTSHLESTAEFAAVRVNQLRECWKHVSAVTANHVVLFAGDLNLRDPEVGRSGGLPGGFVDVWQQCGARPEARFTWDSVRNSNIELPSAARARLRFDRIYLRAGNKVSAEFFGLAGLERIDRSRMFPSDHWAVRAHFRINDC